MGPGGEHLKAMIRRVSCVVVATPTLSVGTRGGRPPIVDSPF